MPLVKDIATSDAPTLWTGATPDWLNRPAKFEIRVVDVESPSQLLASYDATQHPPLAGGDALQRGNLIHDLLEGLAAMTATMTATMTAAGQVDETALLARARAYLERHGAAFNETERADMAAEALKIILSQDCAVLFGPNSRAEVPIAGRLAAGGSQTPLCRQDGPLC